MAMGPGGLDQLPTLPLDQHVPQTVLGRRRDGVSFSSSSTYLTVPRFERRGGISYERADKNAIYVRALADGRMRGKTGLGDSGNLLEWEHKLIEKLGQQEGKLKYGSRFLSMHKVHRRKHSSISLSRDYTNCIDDCYHCHAQLVLTRVSNWDFNVFHFDTLTGGRSLLYLAYHIFREYGFIQRFHLDVIKLLRFFSCVEENYHDNNPYHNVIHASDVTQAMYCYLQEEKLLHSVTPFEAMMAIVSAMAHDLDHPGVNQTFLVATANHLAALYQNTSVLEMHHWRCGVGLMQECGVFSHFSNTQWATAIWQFRSLILATDITRQQEFLLRFRRMIDDQEYDYESNINSRHFVLQIALKCADICNPCRTWKLSEKWSRLVCEEFFRQGDMERQVGVPVTPVCDRYSNTVAKIQIGFMEVVVRPLFMEWKRFLPTDLTQKMLSNILSNKCKWQIVIEKDAQARAAALSTAVKQAASPEVSSRPEITSPSVQDGNRNNAIKNQEEESHMEREELEEMLKEKEEEGDFGEEADIVENDINLAFHYQTDSEQFSEGGSHSLTQVSEEEHLMILAHSSQRRHSMPIVVRRDIGFYMGLRRDNFSHSSVYRRQSLPTTTLMSSSLLRTGLGDMPAKQLSVDGLNARPKILNLSSSLDTRLDYLNFLPLQSQTHLLQEGSWNPKESFIVPYHTHRKSSSCVELRQKPCVLKEVSECLKAAVSGMVSGTEMCHQQLVGLASSWPSILRAGQKMDKTDLQIQANQARMMSSEVAAHSNVSPSSTHSNFPTCLSAEQTEGMNLLSRPH